MTGGQQSGGGQKRPFVGIHMKCCNVYVRAYLNAQQTAFVAFCPRCAGQAQIKVVKDGGSTDRFFEAT